MRIEREHTAALIVDFQERLVPAIADHEALMERVQILLQGLKALEIPMTVTPVSYTHLVYCMWSAWCVQSGRHWETEIVRGFRQ